MGLAGVADLLQAARRTRGHGYGAPGKGNTLLNYCGIRTDLIDFTVDRNPYKHGRMLPGSRIPVLPPERLDSARPDYVLILPWNLREEIMQLEAPVMCGAGMVVLSCRFRSR